MIIQKGQKSFENSFMEYYVKKPSVELIYFISGPVFLYAPYFMNFDNFFRQIRESSPKALIYVDAVHYAPHLAIDVQTLDCDFCVCSTFKFFGPHCGMLFGKESLMRTLRPYKLSVCADTLPGPTQFQRWETGTLNFEGLAGIGAVMDYFASLSGRFSKG